MIKRALISVYDKTGLTGLARALIAADAEIVSTGSTAAAIAAAGLPVTKVEDLTGFPECLDGRVKTLHPAVHAGLLADTARPEHLTALAELQLAPFELLVSNLYPFEQAVAAGSAPEECIEQIDIGGPAMTRAAAKNHAQVAVVTDPSMYEAVTDALAAGGFTLDQRRRLAAQAFARTAALAIAVASGSRLPTRRTPPRGNRPGLTSSGRCGPASRFSATARTRTSGPPCTRRALVPALPVPGKFTARRCPTTTTSTRTRHAGQSSASPSHAW
jgi:AICAR transformylase/IMP cyclohydrolase PurH